MNIMKAFRPLFQISGTSELLKLVKPSFVFHLENIHLICTLNLMTARGYFRIQWKHPTFSKSTSTLVTQVDLILQN